MSLWGQLKLFKPLMFVRDDFLVTMEPPGYCLAHALCVLQSWLQGRTTIRLWACKKQTLWDDKKGQPTTDPLVTPGDEK